MANISVEREMRRAKTSERQGRPDEARSIYTAILEKFPNNARAMEALSQLGGAVGDSQPADEEIGKLVAMCRKGDFAPAAQRAAALLEGHPGSFQLWNLFAIACNGQGNLEEAERGFRKASKLKPDLADPLINLGALLRKRGKSDEAIDTYRRALRIKPDHPATLFNLGNLLKQQQRLDEAIECFRGALNIQPDNAQVHVNLGNALKEKGRPEDAAESYRRALAIEPDNADAHNNLGNVLMDRGDLGQAKEHYRRTLETSPGHLDARNNLGIVLMEEGKPDEAIACFRSVLTIAPDYAKAHVNLGHALKEQGRLDDAVLSYRTAIELDSQNEAALAEMLHQQANMCDWPAFEEFEGIIPKLGTGTKAVPPFAMLSFEDSPENQAMRSRRYARQSFGQEPAVNGQRSQSARIRLGYFSADFHDHATMYLMSGLLREHDRDRFAVHLYSYGQNRDGEMRGMAMGDVESFSDVRDLSDQEVASLARKHELDVAIDLKGYTKDNRCRLFARRLAPIQISYLGYPGTIGADFMDYLIADRIVIPDAERGSYTEKLICLPDSYQPNDNRREIPDTITSRADFALPEDGFVFCCFNQNYKITPREFDIWMRLLGKVQGSVLWLFRSNAWAETNLRREAAARGIDPARLIFADKLAHREHLARHAHADLFVDTFNVNAHTTASDALWAGLPVVTRAGRQFAARVAASLLTAVGIPELIARTESEYEALILDLATDPRKLTAIRSRLAENRMTCPLYDTRRYTRNFESGIALALARHTGGLAPEDIIVHDNHNDCEP